MATNKNTKPKSNFKDSNFKPKFNFYWIYGGLFVLFLIFQYFNSGNLVQREISQNKFETILESNDISKIVILNKTVAQIYIKEEALSTEVYKKLTNSSFFNKNSPVF